MRVGGVAVLAAALLGTVLVAPAEAAGTKTLKIAVVAASDSYLVYGQKRTTSSGFSSPKGSTLYFVGKTGGRHAIRDFGPELFPSLKGSMLTQFARPNYRYDGDHPYDPGAPEYVRWRDLRTGEHGVAELPAGDDYLAAAPSGWLATRGPVAPDQKVAQHLVRYSTDGTVIDLGAPFPAGVPTTGLHRGTAGVLAVSAGDPERASEDGVIGAFRYRPYSTPGRWRDIFPPVSSARAYCSGPSRTHVVCEAYGIDSKHGGEVLIPLDGGKRRWLDSNPKACQTIGLTVVGTSAFGLASSTGRGCVKGQVTQLTSRGVLTTSTRTYGARGGHVAGLGGILVASKDQRTILRLTSADGVPKVVATAR